MIQTASLAYPATALLLLLALPPESEQTIAPPVPSSPVLQGQGSITDVSADGRSVLLIDWSVSELKVRDIGLGTERQLTFRPAGASGSPGGHASFSPDGQTVAFNWSTNSSLELRVIPIVGGEPRVLDTGRGVMMRLQDWSPDGKRLLVVRVTDLGAVGELGLIDATGAGFHPVATVLGSATARMSADGTRIVLAQFADADPTQSDISVIDVKSGQRRTLVSSGADEYAPDWSPDGRSIYFISDAGGRPRLWSAGVDGGAPERRPMRDLVDGDLATIGVSADHRVFVGAEDVGGSTSYVARVDWSTGQVGGVREVRNPPFKGSRRAVPSPDGTRVAFFRRGRGFRVRPGWQVPVVQSVDGAEERACPTALTLRDEPAWSADGRSLIFPMPPEGATGESGARSWRFVRLDLRTCAYEDVGGPSEPGKVLMAGVTARALYYVLSDFSGLDRVMAHDWQTGSNRAVYTPPRTEGVLSDVAVLGEGRRIALASWRGGKRAAIQVVTPGSSDGPKLLGEVEANSRPQLVWSSDGESVIVSGRIAGTQGVWRVPVDGTAPQRLLLNETGILDVRVSGEGNRLAFTRRVARPNELWAYPMKIAR